jgi:hypothetical protein
MRSAINTSRLFCGPCQSTPNIIAVTLSVSAEQATAGFSSMIKSGFIAFCLLRYREVEGGVVFRMTLGFISINGYLKVRFKIIAKH